MKKKNLEFPKIFFLHLFGLSWIKVKYKESFATPFYSFNLFIQGPVRAAEVSYHLISIYILF